MARFLFAVWPFAGHVHPALAVGIALRQRGHEVAWWTGQAAAGLIKAEGFAFFPFTRVDEAKIIRLASTEFPWTPSVIGKLRSLPRVQAKFREWLLDTVPDQVADLEAAIDQWRPDTIVTDLSVWAPFLVLHERRKIPVAVLSVLAACILPGSDVPLWGQGLPRPKTPLQRWTSRVAHKLLHIASARFRGQANAMRARYGLPPIERSVTVYAASMPLYLVPSAREYDYDRRDLPPSVHYIGPCLWDRASESQPPAWLEQIPADQPLVYVTEATIGTSEPFLLKAAAEALAGLPVQVVMTAGAQRDPASLGIRTAPNIRVESYVPQSFLLPRMSLMVTLGGSGGVLAALSAGVPLVVVPTEWDRPENAQRVVEAGAGVRIPAEQCTAEKLRSVVQRVLRDSSFRAEAGRLAAAFRKYEGPREAARLLENLALTARSSASGRAVATGSER